MKVCFFLFSFLLCSILSVAQVPSIIPQPVELVSSEGFFAITKTSTISFNNKDASSCVDLFAEKFNKASGFTLETKQSKSGNIRFNILEKEEATLGKEGYTLAVNKDGILIQANTAIGLFYGIQTLYQLFPAEIHSKETVLREWKIPYVAIKDYPRFGWRGLMLDVSRHFFTKEEVMQYIDQMALYKFNTFHWHLTDDQGWRVEIKSLPKLTEVGAWRMPLSGHFGARIEPKTSMKPTYGGFYTQDEIREIVKYAQERNITIIPEIDVPGHCMAILTAYPHLSCTKDTTLKVNAGTKFSEWYGNGQFKMLRDNTLNPANEQVYETLDKVFGELATLFPGAYIHAGGDECYKGYWKENKECQALMKKNGMKDVEELQGYFMKRVEKIINKHGKKMIGWDEVLEGGVNKETTIMSWRGMKGGIEAAKEGHEVIMSPTTFAYLDYYQGEQTIEPQIYAGLRLSTCYSFEPVPEGIEAKYILGGQGNLWTEQVPTLRYAQYMTFPRAWALSEVLWSPKEQKNWTKFSEKIEIHFNRFDVAEINYSRAVYDPIIKTKMKDGKLMLVMENEAQNLDIYYTLNDAMPDNYCSKYERPVEIPEGPVTLRAITYRDGKPMGHLIVLKREVLEKRVEK